VRRPPPEPRRWCPCQRHGDGPAGGPAPGGNSQNASEHPSSTSCLPAARGVEIQVISNCSCIVDGHKEQAVLILNVDMFFYLCVSKGRDWIKNEREHQKDARVLCNSDDIYIEVQYNTV
jgi:hypothetical protein